MAEATAESIEAPAVEEVSQPSAETPTEAAPETPPQAVVPPPQDDDAEPGGSGPNDVRARREYRTRKKLEQELQAEREQRIRQDERLKALEQQAQKPDVPQKKVYYSAEQVQAAVDSGQIGQAQAWAFLARQEAERVADEREEKFNQAQRAQAPIEKALPIVNEYMALLPWTSDNRSPEFRQYANEYATLVQDGFPDNLVTQKVVFEKLVGSIDKLRAKVASDKMTRQARINDVHTETPAGGPTPTQGNDWTKASKAQIEFWDKTGTSPADRAKEYAYLKARNGRK